MLSTISICNLTDMVILDIDMGNWRMIWEMTVSIWSSPISIWDILSIWALARGTGCDLRRGAGAVALVGVAEEAVGGGLHSSTSQLNLSRFKHKNPT